MKFYLTLFLTIIVSLLMGQNNDIVQWSGSYDTEKKQVVLHADIKNDWVIYSINTPPDGPIPSEIELEESNAYSLSGNVLELDTPIKEFSQMFEVEVLKFKKTASFAQPIEFSSPNHPKTITSYVTYMACDSEKCLPPRTETVLVNL